VPGIHAPIPFPSLRLRERQLDELGGSISPIEIAAGRDDGLELRGRDRQAGDDVANPARLLLEVPDELAPGRLLRVALAVLGVDRDPRPKSVIACDG
jgi:hypothetical protein